MRAAVRAPVRGSSAEIVPAAVFAIQSRPVAERDPLGVRARGEAPLDAEVALAELDDDVARDGRGPHVAAADREVGDPAGERGVREAAARVAGSASETVPPSFDQSAPSP